MSLAEEIHLHHSWTPTLWWLGHSGFVLKFHAMTFYLDPCLTSEPGRIAPSPLDPSSIDHADLILASHTGPHHMHAPTLNAILQASPRAKVVLPKSAAEHAAALGISYQRMSTTDADLRIEFFKDGDYIRVYAVPSANPDLGWTPLGGFPNLGFLIRCGGITIYHAGDCLPYDGIVERLRPYSVTVALLPIAGNNNFSILQAAQLAEDIDARWLVPMHYGTLESSPGDIDRFVDHMLFQRPSQRFKVFQPGEAWTIPED